MVDEQRILVMSPLHYDNEDKTQEEYYYKDVRKPSTLQSRPPSVASSVFPTERANQRCAVSAHARRRLDPRCVLQLSTTAADRDQLCVNQLKICTPPPTRLRSWWTRSRPRR